MKKLNLYISKEDEELFDRAKVLLKDLGSLSSQFVDFMDEKVKDVEFTLLEDKLLHNLSLIRVAYIRYPHLFQDMTIPEQVSDLIKKIKEQQKSFLAAFTQWYEANLNRDIALKEIKVTVDSLEKQALEVLEKVTTKPEE
jgi:hypothetical protein